MDLVVVGSLHAVLRSLLCRGSRLDPLDDHGRTFLARTEAGRHERGRSCQLECQLLRRHRLPDNADHIRKLHLPAVQRFPRTLLGLHISKSTGDEK